MNPMLHHCHTVLILGWLTCLLQSHGAEPVEAPPVRPRIALVLSGGAALGVSHVGVLKALEELRIPVDCVVGTSMGAIVGGLFASGMSPDELDLWFRKADWHFLLSDALPRESESLRNKQRAFDVSQGIAFKASRDGGLKLPTGFVTGRNVMASLRNLTVPVRHIQDFDHLPLPFRAVATDIETGDIAVLKEGDMVEAIRASMSVPGLFVPLRIGNKLLADGGSSSNLPISVARKMGADVIIAVDVSEDLRKEAELDTAAAMTLQVITILLKQQTREELAHLRPGDVYLRVIVPDMSSTDFVKSSQGIDVGYEKTMESRESLRRLSVSPEEYRRYLSRLRIARDQPVLVKFFKVQTPKGEFDHAVERPFEFRLNEHEDRVRVMSRVGDLGEVNGHEVSDFEVIGTEGAYGLLIKTREKKTSSQELTFGLEFGYSSADESNFNLLLYHRMTDLNPLGGEWVNYLSLGNTMRAQTEWYQPLDADRRFFVAAKGVIGSDFVDGRDADGERLHFRQDDFSLGVDVGVRLWQAGELRAGYARGFSEISRRLGVPDDVPSRSQRGWLHADLLWDTLDAPNFAKRGTYLGVSAVRPDRDLGASDDYTRIQGQAYQAITMGKNTLIPRISAAVKVDGAGVPLYDQVPLGGFLNLSGLARGTLFDENFALAQLVYYRQIMELNPTAGRAVYGGASVEYGETWGQSHGFHAGDGTFAGSIFLGADTIVGGLYLGVGVAEHGETAIYLQLGPLFGQGRSRK